MEKNREKTLILGILLVLGCIGVYLQFSVYYSDIAKEKQLSIEERMNYIPKFDYIHGFWLMFMGLFFVFLLVFLDIPSFRRIRRVLYRDFLKKFSEIREKKHL